MVLKTCKGEDCVKPWNVLHPRGDIHSLRDAMNPHFDDFYGNSIPNVKYDHCAEGYILEIEGPTWETDGQPFVPN